VAYDKITNKSRGFAFITFKTVEGARKAVAEGSLTIDGRHTYSSRLLQRAIGTSQGCKLVWEDQAVASQACSQALMDNLASLARVA